AQTPVVRYLVGVRDRATERGRRTRVRRLFDGDASLLYANARESLVTVTRRGCHPSREVVFLPDSRSRNRDTERARPAGRQRRSRQADIVGTRCGGNRAAAA